ncbi:ABC transporter substrate-binding protein [Ferrimonas balearica]|uniref:ABC transporter substrate-binding protein n=1 Tax=Ferrimonas balearica TaxID=44012 RepID=UPI001C99B5C2|nr:ABC transporter substrate-binding protein [Ferrimonas balearica]MBY5920267.1 ABC transporter substrate-binding protein [Ferrimonas balearica]MBY5997048.1 ABC transporter substrate-binding protein [Ferrimonas balearica]
MSAYSAGAIENCGVHLAPAPKAERIVSLNQQATEALIAIGADQQLLAQAYQDDAPASRWAERFDAIPTLAREYPNPESLLAEKPDLLVAGFSSAFSDWGVGARERWLAYGARSYLFESACARQTVTLDGLYRDMANLGQLTGLQAEAESWVQTQQQRLSKLQWPESQQKPKVLLWLREYDLPYVAGCCGAGNLLIEQAGGINVAADLPKSWGHLSWETILSRQPDLILMVDSNWSSFDQKQAYLNGALYARYLNALTAGQLHPIAFSETMAGVRLPDGIERAHQLFRAWQP